jgi:hypothetical protein
MLHCSCWSPLMEERISYSLSTECFWQLLLNIGQDRDHKRCAQADLPTGRLLAHDCAG